jgi:MurNAc alpha-1-phosphate uridylyltransferase
VQILILAGGLGTRLQPLTHRLPKCMVTVNGKPFLEHQLRLLASRGVRDVVLCVGHLGQRILDYFGDGRRFGVSLAYSWERGELLGTAGAIRNAEALLDRQFFVAYGDSYLMLDYGGIMREFRRTEALGTMVVYRNDDRLERSNVVVRDGYVAAYDKRSRLPGMVYVNEGLSVLRRRALRLIPPSIPFSQEQLYRLLIRRRQLLAHETPQRFYEVGSFHGLEEFRQLLATGARA